ncbi:MAG TPA: hypothetical protein VN861_03150 [Candidatus Acidoferrales bacterium]|nr:hypothetical protein [Candidatus Acidoferrales bacterium]
MPATKTRTIGVTDAFYWELAGKLKPVEERCVESGPDGTGLILWSKNPEGECIKLLFQIEIGEFVNAGGDGEDD